MGTRLEILDPTLTHALKARGLRCYDDYVKLAQGQLVGRSGLSRTRRITLGEAGTEAFYLKVYSYRSGYRRTWRDKCGIEVRNYHILRERCGVNVPDVIAHGSRTRVGAPRDAFILTRSVPGAVPLPDYVARHWPEGPPPRPEALRTRLLDESADLVARMHEAGFYHVDLQWRNLIVSEEEKRPPRIFVIDSTRGSLRSWSTHREHGRLRDLSSLLKEARRRLSSAEQVRWLRRYARLCKLTDEARSWIWIIHRDRGLKDAGKIQ